MKEQENQLCKRPYDLGKRQEASDRTRSAVLAAARTLLETGGVRDLTMEALARASGVTRLVAGSWASRPTSPGPFCPPSYGKPLPWQ